MIRKILFVNRFYAPDVSATSQLLSDVASDLARSGHQVVVFTSRMSYDGRATFSAQETLAGVQIHRIWSTRFGRSSTLGRSIDYLTFYASILIALSFAVSRNDILIAKTDPPMLSIPLGIVARLKRAKLVNWLQDIFPEVALELGIGATDGPLVNLLKHFRNLSLRRAHLNIAIGERMAAAVQSFGVPSKRIRIIENFVDDQLITQTQGHSPELRRNWGLKDTDFIVGYSGNLGRAHDLDTILDAAELLQDADDIKFVFIGGGHKHDHLVEQINARHLSNILLQPYQPRSRLQQSLALPNLHWASLVPTLEGYIVPSKLYGIAAAGRPLLMIGATDGEIGRILAQHPFGKCLSAGQSHEVAAFIRSAKNDPEKMSEMGRAARDFIDRKASKAKAMFRWKTLVADLGAAC